MTVPTTLVAQLMRDEGLRLKPYKDSEGLLTIGVGRCLDRVGISLEEAEAMLATDIQRARAGVLAQIPVAQTLDEVRLAALVNMAFNLGVAGLLKFRKFLTALAANDWETAATEMLDSRWHKQVGLRAERLSEQIRTGTWQ